MRLRKITAAEYNTRTVKSKIPTIKVFYGNTKFVDQLFVIQPGTFKFLILVPKEFLSVFNWNEIFRAGLTKLQIKNHDSTPANIKFKIKTFNTFDDSVLFAIK